jgi:molybdenum cofactor cytidylyltransferase
MNTGAMPSLAIVVLAAGYSRRLGHPKALARVRGATLLNRTLAVLAPFAASRIIVVVPPGAGRYEIGLPGRRVVFAANRARATGLASSVRLGLSRARYSAGVLLLPVDLVDLAGRDVARLISRWRAARRRVAARDLGRDLGTPLILPRWLYPRARQLTGDLGLRQMVGRLPREFSSRVSLPSAAADVDTRQDLDRARRHSRAQHLAVCTRR